MSIVLHRQEIVKRLETEAKAKQAEREEWKVAARPPCPSGSRTSVTT